LKRHGQQNQDDAREDTAAKLLTEGYGDPLENILQKRAYWQATYDQQMAKASRHWNINKLAEAGKSSCDITSKRCPTCGPGIRP
jgi:hypothetical protein